MKRTTKILILIAALAISTGIVAGCAHSATTEKDEQKIAFSNNDWNDEYGFEEAEYNKEIITDIAGESLSENQNSQKERLSFETFLDASISTSPEQDELLRLVHNGLTALYEKDVDAFVKYFDVDFDYYDQYSFYGDEQELKRFISTKNINESIISETGWNLDSPEKYKVVGIYKFDTDSIKKELMHHFVKEKTLKEISLKEAYKIDYTFEDPDHIVFSAFVFNINNGWKLDYIIQTSPEKLTEESGFKENEYIFEDEDDMAIESIKNTAEEIKDE